MSDRLKGRSPLARGAGFLEEFSKDEIKGKVDIAALFASLGVQLEKKGSSWMGLCPFHEDTNPSLSVDAAKGLYHCFGCGKGGDVFDLVMRHRDFSFKEALSFLKDFVSTAASTTAKDFPRRDLRALESSPSLADVIAAYRKNLEASSEARDYLQSRGLMLPELLSRFSACYSSGDLIERLGSKQRAALEEMGILKAGGKEHFAGCITLPLHSFGGEPISLYGRKIDDTREPKHLYMSVPHRGLLNPAAYKAYPDGIILTESILDALSLMVIGLQNVDALYGAGALRVCRTYLQNMMQLSASPGFLK